MPSLPIQLEPVLNHSHESAILAPSTLATTTKTNAAQPKPKRKDSAQPISFLRRKRAPIFFHPFSDPPTCIIPYERSLTEQDRYEAKQRTYELFDWAERNRLLSKKNKGKKRCDVEIGPMEIVEDEDEDLEEEECEYESDVDSEIGASESASTEGAEGMDTEEAVTPTSPTRSQRYTPYDSANSRYHHHRVHCVKLEPTSPHNPQISQCRPDINPWTGRPPVSQTRYDPFDGEFMGEELAMERGVGMGYLYGDLVAC